MRYFFAIFVLTVAAVYLIAGKQGDVSHKPPIEIFDDMVRQAKFRPQQPNGFFANGRTSQPLVPGTVARGSEYENNAFNTGKIPGTTNFVAVIPVQLNESLMARGQERFNISCKVCHGELGDGKGVTKKFGMGVVADLHDPRIVGLSDGEIFSIISHGKNLMQGYAANVVTEDRWAIVAYVRALHRSRLALVEDVPAERRSQYE